MLLDVFGGFGVVLSLVVTDELPAMVVPDESLDELVLVPYVVVSEWLGAMTLDAPPASEWMSSVPG